MLISTERLLLREMEQSDFRALTLQEYNGMKVSGTFSKKYRYYETERYHLAYSAVNPNRAEVDSQNSL